MKRLLVLLLFCGHLTIGQNYYVYVTAESEDEVALIKFDGEKAEQVGRSNERSAFLKVSRSSATEACSKHDHGLVQIQSFWIGRSAS